MPAAPTRPVLPILYRRRLHFLSLWEALGTRGWSGGASLPVGGGAATARRVGVFRRSGHGGRLACTQSHATDAPVGCAVYGARRSAAGVAAWVLRCVGAKHVLRKIPDARPRS